MQVFLIESCIFPVLTEDEYRWISPHTHRCPKYQKRFFSSEEGVTEEPSLPHFAENDYFCAVTTGLSTKCSRRNQICISFVRTTSLINKSLVPSSPSSEARLATLRASSRISS